MAERNWTNLIHKHNCKECGIEIYEAAHKLDGRYWVDDFCDACIKKDKRKATALKEVSLIPIVQKIFTLKVERKKKELGFK